MKLNLRNCLYLAGSLFIAYLLIHYWEGALSIISTILTAAMPLFIGFVAAYIVNILMTGYEKLYFPKSQKKIVAKTRRIVCMLAAFLTVIGAVVLIVLLVWPNLVSCIQTLIAQLPPLVDRFLAIEFVEENLPQELFTVLSDFDWKTHLTKAANVLMNGVTSAAQVVMQTVTGVISGVVTAFLSLIFTVYFLTGKEKLLSQTSRLVDSYVSEKWNSRLRYAGGVLNDCFHHYIVGQCLDAVILGVMCALGMVIFGFPYAGMIGALVGFTALIPVAGAYIGGAVGAIMMLTQSPLTAILFILFIVVLQQLEGNLIYPKVVGDSVGLPAIWVLAAVLVGGGLFGILGMLVGVPLTAAAYRIIKDDVQKREAM